MVVSEPTQLYTQLPRLSPSILLIYHGFIPNQYPQRHQSTLTAVEPNHESFTDNDKVT